MQTAIGFVEYLVTGCVALLWIGLLPGEVLHAFALPGPANVVALAWLYVLGMLIDYVSERTVGQLKGQIRKSQEDLEPDRFLTAHRVSLLKDGDALPYLSKELGAEYQAKSTRDRIARGAVVNLLLLAGGALFTSHPVVAPRRWLVSLGALAGAALAFGAWWRFQSLSRRHKKQALATVLLLQDKNYVQELAQAARSWKASKKLRQPRAELAVPGVSALPADENARGRH